jgi:Cu(I)/Ag(I) efflux system membrane fusion protein
VWLEGEVFERDLPAARLGQPVTAEFAALPGTVRAGRIAYVSPTLDPATRTARVRVELANPGLQLKPGMYATLRFSARSAPALSVPRSAVLVTGERALAFVKRADGSFEPRPVTLGQTTEERLEILEGLAAGDTVVASATFLVDAESNLGTSLGGMGDMPGMDIRPPAAAPSPSGGR